MPMRSAVLVALAAGLSLATIPQRADACGGTFCDAGPSSMPVDQTGENIIFVMGDGFTEAHIQIQYDPTTEAEEFAWVIPLMAIPEFEVGSQPLFDNVLVSTVPRYGFATQQVGGSCGGGTTGFAGSGDDGGWGDSTGGGPPPGPEVVLETVVGAFDVVVLSGGTAGELVDWLDANGYQQDPEALPIFDEYLAEGFLFAAFRLTNDAEVSDIHPVMLRFPVEEACVPLRLTRIAAVEDMDVRTFFLADHRVVPETYRHVLVNPLRLDWPNFAANYKEVISLAVDAPEADGRAFVTEYAATSSVVSTIGLWTAAWSSDPFAGLASPVDALTELTDQGLVWCREEFDGPRCDFYHPLVRGLLNQFVPVPVGVDEASFYACLSCYEAEIDLAAWDGAAFGALLEERIIAPGVHAVDVLEAYPTLTRMYTTISPFEMTADPLFHQNPDLPSVDLRSEVATRQTKCDENDEVWILPDGREVYVPNGVWPGFTDEMPYEEEVQEIAVAGAPLALVDQSQNIDDRLFAHNCMYDYPSAAECGNPEGGTAGDTEGGTAGGDPGQDDDAGSGGGSGCGCRTDGDRSGFGLAGLLGLGLLGLRRGRRRPSRRPRSP